MGLAWDNPVFAASAIAAALMVLKVMGQGWLTVYRMMATNKGLVTPEDVRATPLNRDPGPEQLQLDDYVDRSRRVHRNDLENIPAFWVAGALFVLVDPPFFWAMLFYYGFVLARLGHAAAYLTKQNHEVRATFLLDRLRDRHRHGLLGLGCRADPLTPTSAR